MNKEEALNDLRNQYNNPGSPLAFSGIGPIKKFYGNALSVKDIENFLATSRSYTLPRHFKRPVFNPFFIRRLRQQFQVDLIEIRKIAKHNNNYNYILLVIDVFSRKIWARLLRRKTGTETLMQLKSIFEEAKILPKTIHCDKGTEMKNQLFKDFMEDKNITIIYPNTRYVLLKYCLLIYHLYIFLSFSHHAPHVERAGQSLQRLIYSFITANQNYTFYDRLQDLVKTYNSRIHRSTGMSPNDGELPQNHRKIRQMHEKKYSEIKKTPNIKFKPGDKVRFSKLKNRFTRSYQPQAQHEIMKIAAVFKHLPRVLYQLESLSGEVIEGKFYQEELTLVLNQDEYLVEKVLKKKGKKLFVKWLGYPESFNSWINADDVTSVKDIQDNNK